MKITRPKEIQFLKMLKLQKRIDLMTLDGDQISIAEDLLLRKVIAKKSNAIFSIYYDLNHYNQLLTSNQALTNN